MKPFTLKTVLQLKIGFGVLLLLILASGALSFYQTWKMTDYARKMYNHPFTVRRALHNLNESVLQISRHVKDIYLDPSEMNMEAILAEIELFQNDFENNLLIVEERYLGPRSDLDSLKANFIRYHAMLDISFRLIEEGRIEEAKKRSKSNSGAAALQVERVLFWVKTIGNFASIKAEQFKTETETARKLLNLYTIALAGFSLVFAFLLLRRITGNINKPLTALTEAATRFREGDLSARSEYQSNNEFGMLSQSFNHMAEAVERDFYINSKVSELAGIMLGKEDATGFAQSMLSALMEYSGTQTAAIYLLSDNEQAYELFHQIGLEESALKSFPADSPIGEFAQALSSGLIRHIANIPEDTHFTFYTSAGKFKPREIITIPVHSGDKTIAAIALASITKVQPYFIQILTKALPLVNARMTGVLANHKIILFSEELSEKNAELDEQKTELYSQAQELINQNRELEVQKQMLNEANRLKTAFLSNMSHELRTPLNSVIALSGVLNRRIGNRISDEELNYLEVIERNGKHLLALINDILDISRIEAGREEIEAARFNLDDLVKDIVRMLSHQALEKQIKVNHIANSSPVILQSDMRKVKQILHNIISNAIKFTEEGEIEISSEEKIDQVIIRVRDTGIGIDSSQLGFIFDEFRQADGSTSRKYGGTGLGLSIAKKLAQLLGGHITVNSEPGKGSVFSVFLPLSISSDNIEEDTGEYSEDFTQVNLSRDDSAQTILLVEDSEPAVVQVRDILEEKGYNILVANNGIEALSIIDVNLPDAIIMDLMMPGIDGFQMLKAIRENPATHGIPILVLTAKHITKEELKLLKQNNISQLIQKGSVNREELILAVSSLMSEKRVSDAVIRENLRKEKYKDKPLIAVIEDNEDNLLTFKAVLGDYFRLVTESDGSAGYKLVKDYKPDLILLDIGLPGMDGREVFKMIRSDSEISFIPIVAVSASVLMNEKRDILGLGFDAFLSKPVQEKMLISTINKLLYEKNLFAKSQEQ